MRLLSDQPSDRHRHGFDTTYMTHTEIIGTWRSAFFFTYPSPVIVKPVSQETAKDKTPGR